MPFFRLRPKSIADASCCTVDLYTVQVALEKNGAKYENFDYLVPFEIFPHGNTSHYFSSILRALASLDTIGSTLVLTLDNAAANKNMLFVACLGWSLERIPNLREVFLLYPSVGHTHTSVDAHFGSFEDVLRQRDMLSPDG